jgi:N-acetylglucosamine-6-phosphate deacetylase
VPIRRRARRKITRLRAINPVGLPGVISFDHRIVKFEPQRRSIDDRLLPGFIDLQVNGAFGIDVMSASAEDLLELSRRLVHEGTTAWLPTVITSPIEKIERCDAIIAEAMVAQAEMEAAAHRASENTIMAAILGMHLEGPFIAAGRLGAHPPLNLVPRDEALERILALRTLRLITVAPELEGALEAIRVLRARGVAVSLGHSDATYDEAAAAVAAGARMFTHVFNAMRPMHHREPGIAGAALSFPDTYAALIPDGVHVHPAILRMAWMTRGPDHTIFTTDRVAVADTENCTEAAMRGGVIPRAAVADGAARLADGTIAGSIVTMHEAVKLMNRCAAIGVYGAARAASINPAQVLNLIDRGRLTRRSRADLILVDRELNLKTVFVGGRELA